MNKPLDDVYVEGQPGGINIQAVGFHSSSEPNAKLLRLDVHPLPGEEALRNLAQHLVKAAQEWVNENIPSAGDPVDFTPAPPETQIQ